MFDGIAAKLKQPGAIGIIPTDTVYGVVARAADQAAAARLYTLKSREQKPGTLIAANLGQLEEVGLKHRYLKAVEQFWPGALSVIIPAADPALTYLHQNQMSLAARVPKDDQLLQLLQKTGALLTSSANPPGQPTAVTLQEARNYFGDSVDFYVNGGNLAGREPSTVIRIIDDAIEVLRQGAVHIDETGKIKP